MKTNQKGFTLIELLAVIIILAIIALIAIPTIMSLVQTSRDKAALNSAHGLASAAELWYANYLLENDGALPDVTEFNCSNGSCSSASEKLEIKGNGPVSGTISVTADGAISGSNIKFSSSDKTFKIEKGVAAQVK